jgi:predicted AAA+ superfamily ATPase
MEIKRTKELQLLQQRLEGSPIVAILGPRQCGKTTLSHQLADQQPASREIHFFDLEDPKDLARLENPVLALENLKGLVVIDEIQKNPGLFSVLRVLVDKNPLVKYLILGSASRELLSQSSESLAGRISYLELGGFSVDTLPHQDFQKLWVRGGFPRSFLAKSSQSSYQWRMDFITTFLERDVPNLGINIPAKMLRKFWLMLSHYHGQIFNASEIGRSLEISDATAKRYLDILAGTFLIRQLQPWSYNTQKRLVKRPKIYFRDSGLFHALLSVVDHHEILSHPKLGASWEGFALEQTIEHLGLQEQEVFFWSLHTGGELDMVFLRKGRLWGVEVKYHQAPTLTASMKSALSELSLAHLWVIYPGKENYGLDKKVSVIAMENLGKQNWF